MSYLRSSLRQLRNLGPPRPPRAGVAFVIGLIVSAAVVTLLATALVKLLGSSVREEALSNATTTAKIFADLTFQADEYDGGRLTREAIADFNDAVAATPAIAGARLWRSPGEVVATMTGALGIDATASGDLRAALSGEHPTGQVIPGARGDGRDASGDQTLIEAYVPLPPPPGGTSGYALELHLPYGPVAAHIATDTRRLEVMIAAAALLLYLALLPGISRGSGALARVSKGLDLRLEREFRKAIERRQLVPHYQPKLDLRTGEVVGVEALVRWLHPTRGQLGPAEFLPRLSGVKNRRALTRYMLEDAVARCRAWLDQGRRLTVAVNITPDDLGDSQFPDQVRHLMESAGVPPGLLVLEISEDAITAEPAATAQRLQALQELGVRLSLDDFGTGHSSLSRLSTMPLHEVKIDQSFVDEMSSSDHVLGTVRMIIDLGRHLRYRVVGEGVETPAQMAKLKTLGCDEAQGHCIARPMSWETVNVWLSERERARMGEPSPTPHESPSQADGLGVRPREAGGRELPTEPGRRPSRMTSTG